MLDLGFIPGVACRGGSELSGRRSLPGHALVLQPRRSVALGSPGRRPPGLVDRCVPGGGVALLGGFDGAGGCPSGHLDGPSPTRPGRPSHPAGRGGCRRGGSAGQAHGPVDRGLCPSHPGPPETWGHGRGPGPDPACASRRAASRQPDPGGLGRGRAGLGSGGPGGAGRAGGVLWPSGLGWAGRLGGATFGADPPLCRRTPGQYGIPERRHGSGWNRALCPLVLVDRPCRKDTHPGRTPGRIDSGRRDDPSARAGDPGRGGRGDGRPGHAPALPGPRSGLPPTAPEPDPRQAGPRRGPPGPSGAGLSGGPRLRRGR
jgi:hypothetical protein